MWLRLFIVLLFCLLALPAQARDNGRYASLIVDADGLEILHARQIDEVRYPASLTKIMTLHLTFEAIEAGHLSLGSSVEVSAHAAATPPFKMGLRAGQRVSIDTLIQAVAVRSANDAATVLAEAVGGTETAFVNAMNAKAAELGMQKTEFRNPHGLPDAAQVTTARDMAKLGLATLDRFPQHYHYFGQKEFRGKRNTNALLRQRDDVDGFKTGYTRASGFNLVVRAVKEDRSLLAVVLGGASSAARNQHMSELIDRGFEVMTQAPQVADAVVAEPSLIAASAKTVPFGQPSWAMQIDGFDSPAEAAILSDTLVRMVGQGHVRNTPGSIRIDALDHAIARALCADHDVLLGITPRRCKVLQLADPS